MAGAALSAPRSAQAVNWAKVPAKKVMLLYPAQTSWERLMSQERHSGRRRFLEGKNCFSCHGNIDEHPLGDALAHAEKFKEPTPIPGKTGFLDLEVKTARDADNLYVRLEFNPGQQPDAGMDKDFETKVTMMIDDGSVTDANRAGCWVACHDDSSGMARGNNDNTKYLYSTRIPGGAGAVKSAEDLEQIRGAGGYLEYWQARINSGAKAVPIDGTVLEKRSTNMEPAIKADAMQNKAGGWTVTFTRKLTAVAGHKDIVPGKTYTVGFSIHAGHTAKRFHYVSFERTLMLDQGTADFVAAAN